MRRRGEHALAKRIVVLPQSIKAAASQAAASRSRSTDQTTSQSTAQPISSTAAAQPNSSAVSSRVSSSRPTSSSSIAVLSPVRSASRSSSASSLLSSSSSSASSLISISSSSLAGISSSANLPASSSAALGVASCAAASSSSGSHAGAITGGVAGGLLGVALLVAGVMWWKGLCRGTQGRSRRSDRLSYAASFPGPTRPASDDKSYIAYVPPRKSVDSEEEQLDPKEVGPWTDIVLDAPPSSRPVLGGPPVQSISSDSSDPRGQARSTRSTDMLRKALGRSSLAMPSSETPSKPIAPHSCADCARRSASPKLLPSANRGTGGFFRLPGTQGNISPVPQGSLFPPPRQTTEAMDTTQPLHIRRSVSPLAINPTRDSPYPETSSQRQRREAAETYFAASAQRDRSTVTTTTFIPRDSAPPVPSLPPLRLSKVEKLGSKDRGSSSREAMAGVDSMRQPTISDTGRRTAATMSSWAGAR